MARLDDPKVYNPFGGRLAELTNPALPAERRRTLWEELVVWEAAEVAHGYRHLTVVHGDPTDLPASRNLSAFYDTLQPLVDGCEWVRVRGDRANTWVTITVRGDDADKRIGLFAAAAAEADPGGWTIVASACPPEL